MSLFDQLHSRNDHTRLDAADSAGESGDFELVDTLLAMALHDRAEVRTEGGLAEVYRHVGDAAAEALRAILEQRDELDPRIRAAATDLAQNDDRVAFLLYYLGPRYQEVRQELESSTEDRLRLRALKAFLSIHRPAELTVRFLADPSPDVRVEALQATKGVGLATIEALLEDPVPRVRLAAAQALRFSKSGAAFVAAARTETDRGVRQMLMSGLKYRPRDRAVRLAMIGFLADGGPTQRDAAGALAATDDPGVAAAFASRILIQTDEWCLTALLDHQQLLRYAPELRNRLEHLHRHTPDLGLRRRLTIMLEAEPALYAVADPAAGLDPAQSARLHREALGWALAALESGSRNDDAESAARASLRAWLTAPGDDARTVPELAESGPGAAGECLRAAVSGDLRQALAAGVQAAEEAATGDGVVLDAEQAGDLARLAQLYTARQIRAGVDPLPPGRLSPLLLHSPDALTVGMNFSNPSMALKLRQPRPVGLRARPVRSVLLIRCPGCAVPLRVEGPLNWAYRDDDRVTEYEDGFTGALDGTCRECGTAGQVRVRLSLARSRADDSGELTWDAANGW